VDSGRPFYELLSLLNDAGARFGIGRNARYPTIEYVVDICENALAYDGMLVIGAVTELYTFGHPDDDATSDMLRNLQKRLKYGLPSSLPVMLYELGFSDRVIAIELSEVLGTGSARSG